MASNIDTLLYSNKIDTAAHVGLEDIPFVDSPLCGRNAVLLDAARGMRVLHIGFADHLEVIEQKLENGTYLHANLDRESSYLAGIDSNNDAIEFLRTRGFNNLFHTSAAAEVTGRNYDIVLVPDVIEHLGDTAGFFEMLQKIDSKAFLFSTPNALCFDNRVRLREEFVNSDHTCWYSPYTLMKMLAKNGFVSKTVLLVDDNPTSRLKRLLLKRFPLLRQHLLISASHA